MRRHDTIAHERQRKLALLLLFTNFGIAVCAGAMMLHFDWKPEPTSFELVFFLVFIVFSWVNLLIAAGAVGLVAGLFTGLMSGPSDGDPPLDDQFLARHRMIFYYAGVLSNLLAFALVTEVTGGLAESPFVALLVAFVLTAQQLSRFRTQSGVMLLAGLAVAVLMLLLEPLASEPASAAPHQLEITAVLLALVGGGLLSYIEKPQNHYIERHVQPPSKVLVYRDGKGTWRFSFYQKFHQQDPVLLTDPNPAENMGKFPSGLEEQFMKYASEMAAAAGWETPTPRWPEDFTTCFVVRLAPGGPR